MSIAEIIERLEQLQGRGKYPGKECRNFIRLVYPPEKRPLLKIKDVEVEVVDISERGLKLFNYMRHKFGKSVKGLVFFTNGRSIEVDGEIVWHYKNELGILSKRLPLFIIEDEAYDLLRYFQKKRGLRY